MIGELFGRFLRVFLEFRFDRRIPEAAEAFLLVQLHTCTTTGTVTTRTQHIHTCLIFMHINSADSQPVWVSINFIEPVSFLTVACFDTMLTIIAASVCMCV